ncbi:MAG: hypothetical protein JJU46_13225 [Balneolaceae bacterium]|nr:hypothetical protein [Balneolaceae bacterium]MCH8548765.1 hypothetical protein [Balneolaceae bacterium]
MPKDKLSPSERAILRELIFPESVEHLEDETGLSFGEIRSDLIRLKNLGYVEVSSGEPGAVSSPFYDSDNLRQFHFKATKIGLKQIQNHAI